MPKREVDKRKTRKALRKLRAAADRAGQEGAPELTTWEKDFVEGVTKRLETYGSAFRDPGKGRLEEALSQRQHHVARVIEKKSRPKAEKAAKAGKAGSAGSKAGKDDRPAFSGSSFKRKSPMRSRAAPGRGPRVRDVNDDLHEEAETPQTPAQKRAALRVIDGGKPPQTPPPKLR
ncbi:MAG TPA: hypothetical protein VGO52_18210 [Hyphomonadaceae bacterium]|jgi:hypothetical protein|nr:hypothetical protein [Hyphomonadaceae bacterium]